jgi:hypothetical protein
MSAMLAALWLWLKPYLISAVVSMAAAMAGDLAARAARPRAYAA